MVPPLARIDSPTRGEGCEPGLAAEPVANSEGPTGQVRLVELGRALACKPRVLLLDEPASGQDDLETERFGQLLVEIADEGTAVLLVEHDMSLVMDVCHCVHVLDLGQIIAVGTPSEIQANTVVLDAYLGTDTRSAS